MLNKIDYRIFKRISTLSINDQTKFDIIVYSKNYENIKKYLHENKTEFLDIPFISSCAIKATSKDILFIGLSSFIKT